MAINQPESVGRDTNTRSDARKGHGVWNKLRTIVEHLNLKFVTIKRFT